MEAPNLNDGQFIWIETIKFAIRDKELDSDFFWMNIFLNEIKKYVLSINGFKFEIKVDFSNKNVLRLIPWIASRNNVIFC